MLFGIDGVDGRLRDSGEQGDEAFRLALGVADEARTDLVFRRLSRGAQRRRKHGKKRYINQSINNPTFTRRIEEKASERRSGFSLEFFASCAWTKRPCF